MLVINIVEASEIASHTTSYEITPIIRWFDGTVEAVKQATVSAETKGRVSEIFFDIGDTVPAGNIILTLVPNEQREGLNQAEAKVSETRATLEAENKNFQRIDEIYKKNIVSKSDWDRASARLGIAKARVASAEATLKTAKEQLSYTTIYAPYGGVVSARHVELGEAVQPGTPLMSGFDPKAMRIVVSLPQQVANTVGKLNKAYLLQEEGPALIPNKISLYPIADNVTGTIKARLTLEDLTNLPRPGEFIKVGFSLGEKKLLLIPIKSVVYRSEVSGVYVIKNNKPVLRQVRLGSRIENKIEVLSGLQAGEKIALDPVQVYKEKS
jgi:RND family efflux transporter MFP subunit